MFVYFLTGMLMFQLKRKNADMIKPKYKRPRAVSHEDLRTAREPTLSQTPPNKLPFLVELNPGKVMFHGKLAFYSVTRNVDLLQFPERIYRI